MTNIILGSVPKSIQDICGTQGIFHIRWKKKDNRKYIIKKYSDDMSKKQYRNNYYNTIQKIVANKKSYFVKVVDTKNIRFGLIERVDNDKG